MFGTTGDFQRDGWPTRRGPARAKALTVTGALQQFAALVIPELGNVQNLRWAGDREILDLEYGDDGVAVAFGRLM